MITITFFSLVELSLLPVTFTDFIGSFPFFSSGYLHTTTNLFTIFFPGRRKKSLPRLFFWILIPYHHHHQHPYLSTKSLHTSITSVSSSTSSMPKYVSTIIITRFLLNVCDNNSHKYTLSYVKRITRKTLYYCRRKWKIIFFFFFLTFTIFLFLSPGKAKPTHILPSTHTHCK